MSTIAYVHHKDIFCPGAPVPHNQAGYRGLAYYLSQALEKKFGQVQIVAPLGNRPSPAATVRMAMKYFSQERYFAWAEPSISQSYGKQASKKLAGMDADIVLCMEVKHAAYLKCRQPLVVWPDAFYMSMVDFYDWAKGLGSTTLEHLKTLDRAAAENADLVVLPSDWAANDAAARYQIPEKKLRVIPYGANETCDRTPEDIEKIVASKSRGKCSLLFSGVEWQRKGGDIAVKVVRELNRRGLTAELNVLGGDPPLEAVDRGFVHTFGFVDKSTKDGRALIERLHSEAHFFIMPTRADLSPHVLCEANSYGLPNLASAVGGIRTIIKSGVNGECFEGEQLVDKYCDFVTSTHSNWPRFTDLCISSFGEYSTRLNWNSASEALWRSTAELIENHH